MRFDVGKTQSSSYSSERGVIRNNNGLFMSEAKREENKEVRLDWLDSVITAGTFRKKKQWKRKNK